MKLRKLIQMQYHIYLVICKIIISNEKLNRTIEVKIFLKLMKK